MGIADRHIEYRENQNRRRFGMGQPGNALVAIIIINIVLFLLILLTRVFHLYTHQGESLDVLSFDAIEWFALPGDLVTLSERPWTLITFMFSHGGLDTFPLLISMLSNMLWLYAFGYIMQDLSGNRLIFPIYIYGALAGAVFFIIALYSIPVLQPAKGLYYLAGSSTGSMAIAIAVTTMAPNYRIFRNIGTGIPVWVLTSIFLLINFISAFANKNPNSFGILGAAFAGFIFVFFLRRGKDGSTWMNNLYDWFINLFNPHKQKPGSSVKEKVFYNTGSRQPYTRSANVTQQRVDEILDKINQKGYHFLTDEEKNILKKASEE